METKVRLKLYNEGITLIALIITIIIMLILVGVTITVAMQGGLFETSRDASTKTNNARIFEQIQAAVAASYRTEKFTQSQIDSYGPFELTNSGSLIYRKLPKEGTIAYQFVNNRRVEYINEFNGKYDAKLSENATWEEIFDVYVINVLKPEVAGIIEFANSGEAGAEMAKNFCEKSSISLEKDINEWEFDEIWEAGVKIYYLNNSSTSEADIINRNKIKCRRDNK